MRSFDFSLAFNFQNSVKILHKFNVFCNVTTCHFFIESPARSETALVLFSCTEFIGNIFDLKQDFARLSFDSLFELNNMRFIKWIGAKNRVYTVTFVTVKCT